MKCRFCGSMLDGSGAGTSNALLHTAASPAAPAAPATVLFEGSPSWKAWFWTYVLLAVTVVGIFVLNFVRTSQRYKITDRNIDYETGVLSKRVETLQLWRVKDIDFRQSLWERMLGIARICVFTKDLTDPELVIKGLPASREIFDKLKDSVELARQQRVVGLVE